MSQPPMSLARRVVLPPVLGALGGLMLAAAFAPIGVMVLAPLGLAVALLGLRPLADLRGARVLLALVPGLALGLAFMLPLMSWLGEIGTDAWIAVGILEASFYAVWAVVAVLVMRLPAWPLWTTLAWVAFEGARGSYPFGGFPWGRLAFATLDTPYADGAVWWGANGVSLLVAGTGVGLAWAVLELRRRPRVVAGAVVGLAALVLLPGVLPAYDATSDRTARVAAVQGDVPGPGNDVLFDSAQLTENHVEATVELGERVSAGDTPAPDLVVWPENSTTVDPFGGEPGTLGAAVTDGITRAVDAVGVPVLVGAIVDAPTDGQVLNQGIVWTPESGPADRYAKWHPVPFGEFIPLRDSELLGGVVEQVERLDLVPRDMLAGTRTTPLDAGGIAVADAICFDVAYDDGIGAQVRNGAELLVVQTSNALFIDTPQIDQQFEISRLRAMESGRTAVVAAINGVSGVIGPDGEVLEAADVRSRAVLEADVELASGTPPSAYAGPWLGRGAGLLTGLAVLAAVLVPLPYRRRREREAASAGRAPTHEEQEGA